MSKTNLDSQSTPINDEKILDGLRGIPLNMDITYEQYLTLVANKNGIDCNFSDRTDEIFYKALNTLGIRKFYDLSEIIQRTLSCLRYTNKEGSAILIAALRTVLEYNGLELDKETERAIYKIECKRENKLANNFDKWYSEKRTEDHRMNILMKNFDLEGTPTMLEYYNSILDGKNLTFPHFISKKVSSDDIETLICEIVNGHSEKSDEFLEYLIYMYSDTIGENKDENDKNNILIYNIREEDDIPSYNRYWVEQLYEYAILNFNHSKKKAKNPQNENPS